MKDNRGWFDASIVVLVISLGILELLNLAQRGARLGLEQIARIGLEGDQERMLTRVRQLAPRIGDELWVDEYNHSGNDLLFWALQECYQSNIKPWRLRLVTLGYQPYLQGQLSPGAG